jgi:hypothetical protein
MTGRRTEQEAMGFYTVASGQEDIYIWLACNISEAVYRGSRGRRVRGGASCLVWEGMYAD